MKHRLPHEHPHKRQILSHPNDNVSDHNLKHKHFNAYHIFQEKLIWCLPGKWNSSVLRFIWWNKLVVVRNAILCWNFTWWQILWQRVIWCQTLWWTLEDEQEHVIINQCSEQSMSFSVIKCNHIVRHVFMCNVVPLYRKQSIFKCVSHNTQIRTLGTPTGIQD